LKKVLSLLGIERGSGPSGKTETPETKIVLSGRRGLQGEDCLGLKKGACKKVAEHFLYHRQLGKDHSTLKGEEN